MSLRGGSRSLLSRGGGSAFGVIFNNEVLFNESVDGKTLLVARLMREAVEGRAELKDRSAVGRHVAHIVIDIILNTF